MRPLILSISAGLLFAACTQEPVEAPLVEAQGPAFAVGEPLVDARLAVVLTAESTADTLRASEFTRNIERLNSMFPDVMRDPEQETQIRREIVKQFVVERLILAEAASLGQPVTEEAIAERLDTYKSMFADDGAYQAELERFQQSESDLRDQFRIELAREAMSNQIEEATPQPSDEDVEEYRTSMAERVLAQHILFMVNETVTEAERTRIRDLATAVLDSAKSGSNFGDLARRHSDDAGTAAVGGELPWFRRGEMVPEFEEAAFSLDEPRQISPELVLTTYGYHIIRLVDRQIDDPMSADSAANLLWQRTVRTAEREFVEDLQSAAEVRVNPSLIPSLAN